MKKIVIENCGQCPHKKTGGGFAAVSYIPSCRLSNRELPYTVRASTGVKVLVAGGTNEIPNWCKLKDN